MKKIRVGVIGAGAMGMSHVRLYSSNNNVDLLAVCDKDEKVREKVSKEYPVKCYEDYKLIEEELDAVSVCFPTKLHKEVALYFINKGVNVLIEKPIAADIDEAKELILAAKEKKVKLMVGHVERFNPVVMEIKKRIKEGELGRIFNISTFRFSPFPHRVIDVGVTIDLAVHDIDVVQFLNESKIIRAFAETSKKIHASNEDLLNGLLKFENGVTASINANWLTPRKIRELYVTGEKGIFVANYLTQELVFYNNKFTEDDFDYSKGVLSVIEGDKKEIPVENMEPLKFELEAFIDCIINDGKPMVSGEEALRNLEIASMLIEAAKKNKVVDI